MKQAPATASSVSSELQKIRSNRLLMVIFSLLLAVAVIWTMLSIFNVQDESDITKQATKVTTPINPNLDEKVFSVLQQKPYYDETQLENFPIYIMVRDRTGNYTVLPYDTPAEEIERITQGSTPSRPTSTPRPASTASGSAVVASPTTSENSNLP